MNPWLNISAEDYSAHMEHESIGQGALLREHLGVCVNRVAPNNLMFLGAGIGKGLDSDVVSRLDDILAIDVNPAYLAILRKQFSHLPLRTCCCDFPNGFDNCGKFDLVYGVLFFEYVEVDAPRSCIAGHLS